jgi:O-antigen ligase
MAARLVEGRGLIAPAALVAAPLGWLAATEPLVALAAAGVTLLALLTLLWAEALLVVLVAALPWEDALSFPTETVTVVKLLGLLLFAAWLLRALAGRDELRLPAVLLPVALLGGAVGLSLVVSPDPAAGVLTALRYALFIVFFFLVIQLCPAPADVRRLVRVIVLSAAVAAAWGLYQFLALGEQRAGGPIADPNDFAYVMACILPLAIHLATSGEGRRLVWAGCCVLLFGAVLATLSRGALVGLVAVAMWLVVTRRVPLGGAVLAGAMALGVLALSFALWAPLLQDRLESKERIAGKNVGSRQALWDGAIRMSADRPILGVGPGRFGDEAPAYVRNNPILLEQPVVHNSYLQVLAETGALALAAFLAFLAATWRLLSRARAAAIAAADVADRRLVTAMQATTVVAVVSALFLSVQLTTPFWLIGALAAALAGGRVHAARPGAEPAGSHGARRAAPALRAVT